MTFHWSGKINVSATWTGWSGWWSTGGITSCIAAYQPKDAWSLADSYVNLVTPGTYNLTVGSAPTWDVINGWKFVTNKYLNTNITGGNSYTAIVRFSTITVGGGVLGESTSGSQTRLDIFPIWGGNSYFRSGGTFNQAVTYTSGVLAVTPAKGYANGSPVGALSGAYSGSTTYKIYIGCTNVNNSPSNYLTGYIQALAIYNATLSDANIAALTTAMNAL